MAGRSLHIAWLGSPPAEGGGALGVAADLLEGLAGRGHRIDYFAPSAERELPPRFSELENVNFIWGTASWKWRTWYNQLKITAFATGLYARAVASVRLRKEVTDRHARDPYDLIFQNSSIESLAVPAGLARRIPLVIRPDTHLAGELRCLIAERRIAFACQPRYVFFMAAAVMSVRALVQRIRIRRASLLICISEVFRDHLVHDYRFPMQDTVVVPNPVQLARFANGARPAGEPPTVLVLGRVSVRKGVEDVVAVAKLLLDRGVDVRIRVVGGSSLWSDYTKLLADLPPQNSEYLGPMPAATIPAELARADVLLQASKYEPFGLTVAEALAAGVPVVATTEVGAIEGVDGGVLTAVAPGDVEGMASAITATLERLRTGATETRALARREAERQFAPEIISERLSDALVRLVGERGGGHPADNGSAPGVDE